MNYFENQNYYDILGVDKDATLFSIEKAKDRLKFGDPDDRVPFSMWDKIDEAYRVLSNPEKRKEYDRTLEEDSNSYSNSDNESLILNQESVTENILEDIEPEVESNILEEDNNLYSSFDNQKLSNLETEESDKKVVDTPKKEIEYVPLVPLKDVTLDSNQQEDTALDSLEHDAEEISVLPKLKRVGKNVILAVPNAVLATITIIKELNKREKYLIQKETTEKEITEVKTPDSELIEEYRQKLDQNIEKALNEYYFNYDLIIDKLRYENYIELLKKRIELKENEVVKKGRLTIYKLQLTALRKQLETFKISLEKVNNKIKENKKRQKLSKIYENLGEVNTKISQTSSENVMSLKKLQVRKNKLLEKRKLKIDKTKSNRELHAIFKDSFSLARAKTENFVNNIFVPISKIDEQNRQR